MATYDMVFQISGEIMDTYHTVEDGLQAMLKWGIENPDCTDFVMLENQFGTGELHWLDDTLYATFDFTMLDVDLEEF